MNAWWLLVAGVGLLVLAVSVAAARQPSIGAAESTVFHAVNGLPNFLFPVLWLPMQLGNLVVGTLAGLAVAAVDATSPSPSAWCWRWCSSWSPSASSAGRWPTTSPCVSGRGPARSGAILRGGDVPTSGPSFPSGHVILVAAVGTVVAPNLPAVVVGCRPC